jgi:hypothetical protein
MYLRVSFFFVVLSLGTVARGVPTVTHMGDDVHEMESVESTSFRQLQSRTYYPPGANGRRETHNLGGNSWACEVLDNTACAKQGTTTADVGDLFTLGSMIDAAGQTCATCMGIGGPWGCGACVGATAIAEAVALWLGCPYLDRAVRCHQAH